MQTALKFPPCSAQYKLLVLSPVLISIRLVCANNSFEVASHYAKYLFEEIMRVHSFEAKPEITILDVGTISRQLNRAAKLTITIHQGFPLK